MNRMHYMAVGTVVLAIAIMIGCDHSKPNTTPSAGLFADFDDTISQLRLDPDLNTLRVRPDIVTVESISDAFEFEVDGGQDPFTWSVANPGNGTVTVLADSTGLYTATRVAKNAVVVFDSTGHWGAGEVFAVNGLDIVPDAVTIETIGGTIQFTATGGEPPYTFVLGSPGIGMITVAGLYTRTGEGDQVVTVIDANEAQDSATVSQPEIALTVTVQPDPTLGTNQTVVALIVDGGVPPYAWAVFGGVGTLSVVVGSSTTFIRTTPTTDGSAVITVTDSSAPMLTVAVGLTLDQSAN